MLCPAECDNFSQLNISDLTRIVCESPPTGLNFSHVCYQSFTSEYSLVNVKLVLTGFLFSTSVIGNGLVIILIWQTHSFHSSLKCHLVNLAVSDLLITCVCMWSHTLTHLSEQYPLWPLLCGSASAVQGQYRMNVFAWGDETCTRGMMKCSNILERVNQYTNFRE